MLCERQRFLPRRSERQARAPPRPAVLRMNPMWAAYLERRAQHKRWMANNRDGGIGQ